MKLNCLERLCWASVLLFIILLSSKLQRTSAECSGHQFKCKNNHCIPLSWQCDEDDDCKDKSDEEGCVIRTCSETEFQCANKKCIPGTWLCDNEDDCEDNSDEDPNFCQNRTCAPDHISCGSSSVCIPVAWRCDGQNDCPEGFDEKNCDPITCTQEEFSCSNNGKCITKRWICDLENDCEDGSDEMNCPNVTCSSSEFMCQDGKCIPQKWHCDGDTDCVDKSDELNCPTIHKSPCPFNEFMCANGIDCIHLNWQCDGGADCPDASDEVNCTNSCRPDQFQCNNRECIPGLLQCNGEKECHDGSDEVDCPPLIDNVTCEFDCGQHNCITLDKVCDGKNDCGQWEDEPKSKCHVNECLDNNGNCSQLCVDTPTSYHCACHTGFQLVDNRTCDDIDECAIYGSCSQKCLNTKGGYKCDCIDGYSLANHRHCKVTKGQVSLLFANRHDIRKVNVETKQYVSVVKDLKSTIGLDYIHSKGLVIWSDVSDGDIKSAPLESGGPVKTIISSKIQTPDGIAVDWIHELIYWTDTGTNTIEVANLDGKMRKTLFDVGLDEPRAIAVDPLSGWIFWSDWGEPAKIERGGMDGFHRSVIIKGDIQWPNGLTLDYVDKRVYWADAKLNLMSSAKYDGSDRRIISSDPKIIRHPFSLDVFEEYVYWTDWGSEAIHRINKYTGKDMENITIGVFSPMDMHIYHELKQPAGENFCEKLNSRCSHLCLPAARITDKSPKFTCACPDSMTLIEGDLRTCIDIVVNNETVVNNDTVLGGNDNGPTPSYLYSNSTEEAVTALPEANARAEHASSLPAATSSLTDLDNIQNNSTLDNSQFFAKSSSSLSNITDAYDGLANDTLGSSRISPPQQYDPIYPSNSSLTSEQESASQTSHPDIGTVAGIVTGVVGVLVILVLGVVCIYKQYLRRNITSMNFDNPVYRKTTEDQFSLEKNQYQPARSYPPSLEPLTSPGTNEFV